MYTFALKRLLGLAFVGVIWTVSGEMTSLNSSASSDRNTTAGARERRGNAETEIMTNDERKEYLAEHNAIRSDMTGHYNHEQPPAANMMRMYWSSLLEASAVLWSKKNCKQDSFVHGQPDGFVKQSSVITHLSKYGLENIGQNIYKGGDKSSVQVKLYGGETVDYTYDPNGKGTCLKGKKCGHYTQVVWHDSILVGCGYAKCGQSYLGTCNYMRAGNWAKTPPYTAGVPCSLCAEDKKFGFKECENKLCVPSDRCSPVTECTVVDKDNCLCAESSYSEMVGDMVKTLGDARTIHAGPPLVVYGLLLPLVAILLGHGV